MRRRAKFVIQGDGSILSSIAKELKGKLDQVDESLLKIGRLDVDSYEDREGYPELLELISKHNLQHTFFEGREYTKKEMETAEYYQVFVPYPWLHDPEKKAKYYGTTYESQSICECGETQTSELKLDSKKIGKWQFATIDPEFIVTDSAKDIMLNNDLSGVTFQQARDFKYRESPPISQLIVLHILPPTNNNVKVVPYTWENKCPNCIQLGFLRSELIYEREKLKDAKDFNLTYEYFDAYVNRILIVSAKTRSVLTKHKIRVHGYEPISII
ncbi:hypothetical protein [Cohnella lupini]|uniref:Uncharacterized protein n=1 Tax=Cohnella lupini TaxID=1294267 RepID=A0A3D9HZ76_9BACL|nr:hypothetical protein [Cohnella lupini]RED54735.1 hypothetical protein DFP95_12260 [Cohnella lupini]